MPRKKELKSKYPCVRYRKDINKWEVRSRSKKMPVCMNFDSQTDAETFYCALKSSLLPSGVRPIDKNITTVKMTDRYIEQVSKANCKPSTVEGYKAFLNNHIKAYFKERLAYTITKDDIEKFIIYLLQKKKIVTNLSEKKKGTYDNKLSSATVRKIFILLNASFEHAIDGHLLQENPCLRVRLPKIRKKKIITLDTQQARLLLRTAKEDITVTKYGIKQGEYYLILLLAIITGARQGELIALTWDDIDSKKQSINVDKTFSKKELSDVPKTDSSERTLYNLPDFIFEELKEYRKTQKNNPNNLVFPNNEGNYIDGHNLTYRVLPRLLQKAGLPKVCWHSLRHTNITALAESKVSPAYIQRNSGHSSPLMTIGTYTHVTEAINIQAKEALEVFNIGEDYDK